MVGQIVFGTEYRSLDFNRLISMPTAVLVPLSLWGYYTSGFICRYSDLDN
jgi:hypothetical protein